MDLAIFFCYFLIEVVSHVESLADEAELGGQSIQLLFLIARQERIQGARMGSGQRLRCVRHLPEQFESLKRRALII